MGLGSRLTRASREIVIARRRKHREPRRTGLALRRGHQRATDSSQAGVDLAPARRRIAAPCSARPIEIAWPSRRVDQCYRARVDSRRGVPDPLREHLAGTLVQSAECDACENQRARRRADDREVEKVLADVDAYKWSGGRLGKRPDKWFSSSRVGGWLYDGPRGCVAPLEA